MSRGTRLPGWVKVVVGLAVVATSATAGTGHVSTVPVSPPTTACVQLLVVSMPGATVA